jgi:hypothetical protein
MKQYHKYREEKDLRTKFLVSEADHLERCIERFSRDLNRINTELDDRHKIIQKFRDKAQIIQRTYKLEKIS